MKCGGPSERCGLGFGFDDDDAAAVEEDDDDEDLSSYTILFVGIAAGEK